MKKAVVVTIFILLFLSLGAGIYFVAKTPQLLTPSGTYVQAPTFYYFECSPATQPTESIHVNLATGNSGGFITAPSNTDQWDLYISQTEQTKWSAVDRRIVYQVCHASGSCDPQVYKIASDFSTNNLFTGANLHSVPIYNLLVGDKVYINYQSQNIFGKWKDKENGAEWYQVYKPFILWKNNMFGGGRTEYTTPDQGCNFFSGDKSSLLNSLTNSKKQINTQTTTSNTKVDFYKTRNFIGTYVPISKENTNFVKVNGQTGYCLNRQVFAITTAKTNGGTLQIVDSNFNTLLKSSVDCCPGEEQSNAYCGDDFKWIYPPTEDLTDKDCSLFNPCVGADWMVDSSKTLIRYDCVEGSCVPETKTVECTTNTDCGISQVCDTLNYECVDVTTGEVVSAENCNNGIDDDGDGKIDLEDPDCSQLECKWSQTLKPAKTSSFLFGLIEIDKQEKCVTSLWVILTIIGGIFAILIMGIVLIKRSTKK